MAGSGITIVSSPKRRVAPGRGKARQLLVESSGLASISFLNDCAVMCNDDRKAAVQSKIRCFLISLSVVLSWRVVRSGCYNVLQMGGSPVLFRCAKIGIFGEYGVAGRGKYGCGGSGVGGYRNSRGTRFSRRNPLNYCQLPKTNDL